MIIMPVQWMNVILTRVYAVTHPPLKMRAAIKEAMPANAMRMGNCVSCGSSLTACCIVEGEEPSCDEGLECKEGICINFCEAGTNAPGSACVANGPPTGGEATYLNCEGTPQCCDGTLDVTTGIRTGTILDPADPQYYQKCGGGQCNAVNPGFIRTLPKCKKIDAHCDCGDGQICVELSCPGSPPDLSGQSPGTLHRCVDEGFLNSHQAAMLGMEVGERAAAMQLIEDRNEQCCPAGEAWDDASQSCEPCTCNAVKATAISPTKALFPPACKECPAGSQANENHKTCSDCGEIGELCCDTHQNDANCQVCDDEGNNCVPLDCGLTACNDGAACNANNFCEACGELGGPCCEDDACNDVKVSCKEVDGAKQCVRCAEDADCTEGDVCTTATCETTDDGNTCTYPDRDGEACIPGLIDSEEKYICVGQNCEPCGTAGAIPCMNGCRITALTLA